MIYSQQNVNLLFIGCGNMGQALVTGLSDSGWPGDNIAIVDSNHAMRGKLAKKFPHSHVYTQSEAALNLADIVVLAVKPQDMQSACEQIAAACQIRRPLVVSVAAGIPTCHIDRWLGGELPIVRCMPNAPALVQAGVSGVHANDEVSAEQKDIVEHILNCVGTVCWLEEEAMLHTVTALSGSGPAYFFYLIEALIQVGKELGLSELQAHEFTVATATGAAKLLEKTGRAPRDLRLEVTSRGGTTEAAIASLEKNNMQQIVALAVQEAVKRSMLLAR